MFRGRRAAGPETAVEEEVSTTPEVTEGGPLARPLSLIATLTLAVILVELLLLAHTAAALAGGREVAVVALLGGLADAHASAVAAATLAPSVIPVGEAVAAVGLALAANTAAKLLLAFGAGGRKFAVRLGLLLIAPVTGVAAGIVLTG